MRSDEPRVVLPASTAQHRENRLGFGPRPRGSGSQLGGACLPKRLGASVDLLTALHDAGLRHLAAFRGAERASLGGFLRAFLGAGASGTVVGMSKSGRVSVIWFLLGVHGIDDCPDNAHRNPVVVTGDRMFEIGKFDTVLQRQAHQNGAVTAHCIELLAKLGRGFVTDTVNEYLAEAAILVETRSHIIALALKFEREVDRQTAVGERVPGCHHVILSAGPHP